MSATAIAIVLGVPLAWIQARVPYPGRNIVRAITVIPMVLPPVVGGIALLLALGRRGLAGQYLDHVGVHLPFHVGGAVLAEAGTTFAWRRNGSLVAFGSSYTVTSADVRATLMTLPAPESLRRQPSGRSRRE